MQAATPMCPDPEHAGSRIVRHGSYGPSGRQRYRCLPVAGRAHTFSEFVGFLDNHGTTAPVDGHLKSYRHRVSEIAEALVSIGRGASYRQAALRASAGTSANGQLVANWVRAFGPLVVAPATSLTWPVVLCVGAFSLRRGLPADRGRSTGAGLVVQLAVGTAYAGSPDRLWDARVAIRGGKGEWNTFFDRRGGAPKVLIVERGSDAAVAALRYWSDSPPILVESRPWLRGEVEGHGGPDAPIAGWPPGAADVDAFATAFGTYREALFRRLAPRLAHFSDRDQLDHLLALMRMDLNGDADVAVYANRIFTGTGDGFSVL